MYTLNASVFCRHLNW